jgi:hypothetical protein
MHDIEHAADIDKHDMIKHLHREFLPRSSGRTSSPSLSSSTM